MNCLPTHTSTVINPLPSPCSISPPLPRPTTPLSKVMLSSTRCDFHCSTTVQIHPPPFVMSFHVLLKRSNKWDVLHLLIHLRKILHAVSKECKHFFFFFIFRLFYTNAKLSSSVKEEVTQCLLPYCHGQRSVYCLQFFSIYICIEGKRPQEKKIMWGFLLPVHMPQFPTLPWHSANEDHSPLHLSTSRAGLRVKS